MAAGRETKRDFMTKRSVNKSTLTSENYKNRWFILNDKDLIYKDGSRKKVGSKEKGCIALKSMKAVEEVNDLCLDEKVNVFQIMYQESKGHPYTLYIVAGTNNQRMEWIAAIREGALRESASFYQKYHVGAWTRSSGKYNCCDQIARNAVGCEPAFHVRQVINSPNGKAVQSRHENMRSGPLPTPPRTTPPSSGKKIFVAIYDYEPQTEGDLELRQGEEYEIVDQSRDNWWLANDLKGMSGYIPANYVKKKFDLEIYDWFRKDISRQRCEFILSQEGTEGCFLVRDSSTPGMYTLSLFTSDVNQRVRHYHIQKNNELFFYLSPQYAFASIPELIYYHRHNSGGLSNRLRFPPASRSQPTTAGFGHDRFEIDPSTLKMGEHLGSGCFGTVYKAYMSIKGRPYPVAVKQLREGQMSEEAFIDEAKTMTQLSHRHLVQLYGVVTKSRPLSIVTEYMQHGSLHNYIRRHAGSLLRKPAKLLEYCLHVSQGMEYLESRKYIHRDLAARNCLIGNEDIVKVADFGLARYVIDDEYRSSTGAKFPIKWAPPEVLSYVKFSSKSDCWAFGVLMWEVFSGGLSPYEGMSNAMVVDQICNKRRRLDRPPKCDPIIYKIMLRCWEQRPEDRPTFHMLNLTLEKMGEDWDYSDQVPQMSAPFVL